MNKNFCLIPYWSSELPITLRLKDGVYGEAGNNFSLRQSLFEHQTAPHFYDKIKSPAFLHIYYIQLLKLQIRVPKKISFECWIRNFKADHDSSPINLHLIFWFTKHGFSGLVPKPGKVLGSVYVMANVESSEKLTIKIGFLLVS